MNWNSFNADYCKGSICMKLMTCVNNLGNSNSLFETGTKFKWTLMHRKRNQKAKERKSHVSLPCFDVVFAAFNKVRMWLECLVQTQEHNVEGNVVFRHHRSVGFVTGKGRTRAGETLNCERVKKKWPQVDWFVDNKIIALVPIRET